VAFYAFIGFEDAVNVAEETKDPIRMMPIAILGGLGVATLVYLAVSFTAAMVVSPHTLAASSGALLEVVEAGPIPVPGRLFSVIALLAITNTALINMIMASRLTYGMAREGIVPAVLGKTHSVRQTPWAAIVFTTLLALVLVATGDLGALADTTVMLLLVVFTIVHVANLVLRKQPAEHPHFSVPAVVPVLGAASCLVLLTQQHVEIYLRGAALLLVGLGLWGVNELLMRRLGAARADEPRSRLAR
jgi:amino acid transporter